MSDTIGKLKENEWIALPLTRDVFSRWKGRNHPDRVVMLNKREFLVLDLYGIDGDGPNPIILKYNLFQDEWTTFMELPDSFEWWKIHYMKLDRKNKRLFLLCDRKWDKFTISIDLQSEEIKIAKWMGIELNQVIMADGIIHNICDGGHFIWNEGSEDWEEITVDPAYLDALEMYYGCWDYFESTSCSIHVPRKNIVLMIGGYADDPNDQPRNIGIWRYHMHSEKWEDIGNLVKCPSDPSIVSEMFMCKAVLSSDERYVIICWMDYFYVMDIANDDEYKLMQSSICLPPRGYKHQGCMLECMLRTGDHSEARLLLSGWIRRQFEHRKKRKCVYIPQAIQELMARWCSVEMIHWTRYESPKHHMIPLMTILGNCN